jgi:hypothetical protein
VIVPDSKVAKTYVRPDNTAVLTCTHCGIQKVVVADLFMGRKHKIKVKCSCQKVFIVNLEFRNRVRKQVYLRGTYINHSQKDSSGHLIIQNISVTGLAFSTLDGRDFNVGDELIVELTLDDEYGTEMKKEVIVRSVGQNSTRCEFVKSEDSFGSPLGHYVMANI